MDGTARRQLLAVGVVIGVFGLMGRAHPARPSAEAPQRAVEPYASPIEPVGSGFKIGDGGDAIGGHPAIAHDGANFLVTYLVGAAPYARRITPSGTVLDGTGIQVAAAADAVPSVGFDGTNYVVVWPNAGTIYGARIAPNGVLVDTSPVVLASGTHARPIAIAFDGTNYLICWRTPNSDVMGARISTALVNLDSPGGFAIGTGFYQWVAFGGGQYLVAWHANGGAGLEMRAARVATNGTVLDPGGFAIAASATSQDHGSVASDGTGFFVAWHQYGMPGGANDGAVYGARISAAATVLDPGGIKLADYTRSQPPKVVTFDGTNYVVVWQDDPFPVRNRNTDAFARRVSPAGALVDAEPVPLSAAWGHQWAPTIGYGSGRYLAAWVERSVRCGGTADAACSYGRVFEKVVAPVSPVVATASTGADLRRAAVAVPDWTPESSPTAGPLFAVHGLDINNVYAVGGTPILKYDGTSWTAVTSQVFLTTVSMNDRNNIWALGGCWGQASWDGVSWTGDCGGLGGNDDPYQIGYGIQGFERSYTLGVGTLGTAKYFWEGPPVFLMAPVSLDLWALWGASDQRIYVTGEYGTILTYNRLTNTWAPEADVPSGQNLNAIWGTGPRDIFAVGDFGTILHYDGTSWTAQPGGTSEHLFGVSGVNGSDVYAVGRSGTILHYDGASWQSEASGTTNALYGVTAVCDKVIAVGDGGTILGKDRPCDANIFADGFESGDLLSWCTSASDGGDLAVTAAAALDGAHGLAASVNDTNALFVRDCRPAGESRYRARFMVDPNGFDPGEANGKHRVRLLLGLDEGLGQRAVTLVLRRVTGNYAVMARVLRDDGSRADTGFFAISDGPHTIELEWQRATAPGADNGSLKLEIDDQVVATLTGIDNDTKYIDAARIGAFSVKSGAAGTIFFDAFASFRTP